MKEIRTKIIALAAVALMAGACTACDSVSPDGGNTTTTIVDNQAGEGEAPVSEAPVPEVDDDGSKVSVVEVTEAGGAVVTDADSKPVTELVLVDDKGTIVTDAKGQNAKPNIKATPKPAAAASPSSTIEKPPAMATATPLIEQQVIADGPTVSLPKLEAKAGEEVTFKVEVTKNTGFTALVSWIEVNSKYFEFVSYEGGDLDDPDNEDSDPYSCMSFTPYTKPDTKDLSTLVCLYFNSNMKPLEGDTTIATITLKVKDNTPAGKYDLSFDGDGDGNGAAMCNNYDGEKILIPTPKYVNGSITVK